MNKSALLGIAIYVVTSLTNSFAQSSFVVPPDESMHGQSQAEWSIAWWQWAGSFDRDKSPIADMTGENCGLKQTGSVWFLAGTYGTRRTIRTCIVPKGKYLFFPLINYVVMRPASRSISCDAVKATAEKMTDDVSSLVLEIDGQRVDQLANHRQATNKCFDMGALTPEKFSVYPSAANGYYIMLRPLSPGMHILNFGGILPSMSQAVTYTLLIE